MDEGKSDQYTDNSSDKKYFTQIPNVIDEFPLSVYAFRVYCHIKRVAGEHGTCFQSTRNIARKCNISAPSVTRALSDLVRTGLILKKVIPGRHGEFAHCEYTIQDIWQLNMNYFNEGIKYQQATIELFWEYFHETNEKHN